VTQYSELQISSEILDQPEFREAPRKVIICSTPRSGSYLLCRYMINAGLGVPHEYFNPIVIGQIAPRLGFDDSINALRWMPRGRKDLLSLRRSERAAELDFLGKYLKVLIPRRCQGGVFAAKVHYRDFRRVLDNPAGYDLLNGALFVHLYREDVLRQAVSEHFSQLTGRWGIDDTVTTTPAEKPDFFDVEAIDGILDDFSEQDRNWRLFMARNGVVPMSIAYEKLCEDPFGFVCAIAGRLGIDAGSLTQGYSETAPVSQADRALPSKSEVARHYLASRPKTRERFTRRGTGMHFRRVLISKEA
jgi:LPS sulfotransferase NodH